MITVISKIGKRHAHPKNWLLSYSTALDEWRMIQRKEKKTQTFIDNPEIRITTQHSAPTNTRFTWYPPHQTKEYPKHSTSLLGTGLGPDHLITAEIRSFNRDGPSIKGRHHPTDVIITLPSDTSDLDLDES